MKRTTFKRAPKEPTDPRSVAAVMARSRGRCEARCSQVCTGVVDEVHHRKRRSQGGTDDPGNLLACCALCHRFIHAHPEQAYDMGWLLHSWEGRSL